MQQMFIYDLLFHDNLLSTVQTFISSKTADVIKATGMSDTDCYQNHHVNLYSSSSVNILCHNYVSDLTVMYDIIHTTMNDIITVCGFKLRSRLRSYCMC